MSVITFILLILLAANVGSFSILWRTNDIQSASLFAGLCGAIIVGAMIFGSAQ